MSNAVTDKYVVCGIFAVYMNEEVRIFLHGEYYFGAMFFMVVKNLTIIRK